MRNHKKTKPKIGLALGMGGARGLCHIGVIKVLQQAGIEIDVIAGVSMGAMVGAGYVMDLGIERVQTIALETDWKRLFSLLDIRFHPDGIIDGNRLEDFIKSHIGNAQFSETHIPFSVVATEAESGEKVVFNEGSIAKAVRASLSVPIFFKPYCYDGRVFLDGGLCDPVPVRLVREMGADFVIAVSAFSDLKRFFSNDGTSGEKLKKIIGPRRYAELSADLEKSAGLKVEGKNIEEKKSFNLKDITARMIAIMEEHLALPQLEEADIVITPDMKEIGMLDFTNARDIIDRGERAAREVLTSL
jgi:NTE family protein